MQHGLGVANTRKLRFAIGIMASKKHIAAAAAFTVAIGASSPQDHRAEHLPFDNVALSAQEMQAGITLVNFPDMAPQAERGFILGVCSDDGRKQMMAEFYLHYDYDMLSRSTADGTARARLPDVIAERLSLHMDELLLYADPMDVITGYEPILNEKFQFFLEGVAAAYQTDISIILTSDVVYAAGCSVDTPGRHWGHVSVDNFTRANAEYQALLNALSEAGAFAPKAPKNAVLTPI
jgi:hypothetical protein